MSKLKDETNNRYGYLTVIKRGPNGRSGKAQWYCNCDCGTVNYLVSGTDLRNGHTKSCGCYHKEQTSKACSKDLTGQTIGNFTILGYNMGNQHSGGRIWHCRCNLCGNEEVYIVTPNLTKQESCGCLHSSKGNRKIQNILEENNIEFIQEKRFSDLRFKDTNKQARYDFYLPEYNCLIEYDGRQHFIQGNGMYDNEEKFKITQQHDEIKNQYAKNHNIILIRIPYTYYDNIKITDLLPNTSHFIV